jgi:hypothetical protein
MRGHHPLRREPQHKFGCPDQPKGLSKAAARIWDQLIDDMDPMILRRTDGGALAQLCENEALIVETMAGLREKAEKLKAEAKAEGRELPGGAMLALMETREGASVMRLLRNLERNTVTQRREFGLTPASRARVGPGESVGTPDILDEVLCRPVEKFV